MKMLPFNMASQIVTSSGSEVHWSLQTEPNRVAHYRSLY